MRFQTRSTQSLNCRAFTLIELLVVVAIILILISIALPNFMDARLRAKITGAESEMRSIAVALETYQAEWNRYPPQALLEFTSFLFDPTSCCYGREANRCSLMQLTTPIAYMAEIPLDIFAPDPGEPILDHSGNLYPHIFPPIDVRDGMAYYYWSQESFRKDGRDGWLCAETLKNAGINYVLLSLGPDRQADARRYHPDCEAMAGGRTYDVSWLYDPSNGTRSDGDLHWYRP